MEFAKQIYYTLRLFFSVIAIICLMWLTYSGQINDLFIDLWL